MRYTIVLNKMKKNKNKVKIKENKLDDILCEYELCCAIDCYLSETNETHDYWDVEHLAISLLRSFNITKK